MDRYEKYSQELGPLHFIAALLYQKETAAKGQTPWRWTVMNDDVHAEYLEKARVMVAAWKDDELKMLHERMTT